MNNVCRLVWNKASGRGPAPRFVINEGCNARVPRARRLRLHGLAVAILLALPATGAWAADAVCVDPANPGVVVGTTPGTGNEVACGAGAVASGLNAIAIGNVARATREFAVAVGDNAQALATQSIAIGLNATAQTAAVRSIAIGADSNAVGVNSLAIGPQATATGPNSIAMGRLAQAQNVWSMAIGDQALASGEYSMAIGERAEATGQYSISIGRGSWARAWDTIAVGVQNQLYGAASSAWGSANTITANGSFSHVVGSSNDIQSEGVFVLGSSVSVPTGMDHAVLFGEGAAASPAIPIASITVGGITYDGFDGVSRFPGFIVSIGQEGDERQIKNMSSGEVSATSTDAINGSQLYSTQVVIDNLAQTSAQNFGGGVVVNPDGSLTAPTYGINGTNYDDVGAALAAVDSSLTHYVSINDGGTIQANHANDGALGVNSIAIGPGAATAPDNEGGVAIGYLAQASGVLYASVAVGSRARATGPSSVAIGLGAEASEEDSLAVGVNSFAQGPSSTAVGNSNRVTGVYASAIGYNNLVFGYGSVVFGNGNSVSSDFATVLGTGIQIAPGLDYSVVLGFQSLGSAAVSVDSATVGGITYGGFSGQASEPGHIVSVGWDRLKRQIQNVAAGQINSTSTDAINGSQLYSTQAVIDNLAQTSAQNFGGGVVVNPDGSLTAPAYVVGGTTYGNVGDALAAVGSGLSHYVSINDGGAIKTNHANDGALGINSIAIGTGAATALGATGALAIGNGAQATRQTAVAVGDSALASGLFSTAIGNYAEATGQQSVALGHRSFAYGNDSTSVGVNNTVTGVGSSAFGFTNEVSGDDSHAVGTSNIIESSHVYALGSGIYVPAGFDQAVLLGGGSTVSTAVPVASATVGGITYGGFNGDSSIPGFVLSIGLDGEERQIQNVAAGRISSTSTDAINGSQLYSTQVVIDNLAQTSARNFGGGVVVNPDGSLSAPVYGVSDLPYDNVGGAIGALDWLVTWQGFTTASALGGNSSYNFVTGFLTTELVVGGNTYNNVNDALNAVSASSMSGWNLTAQGANSSNVTSDAVVDLSNGDGNIVVSKSSANNDVTFDLADNITVTSVVAGNTTIDTNGIVINGGAGGPVSLSSTGLNNGGNTITNVAAGVNATDAVNVGQLNAATGGMTTAGMNFTGNDNSAGDVHRDLGQTLSIRGQASTTGTYSGSNVRTVTDPASGAVNIQIADAPKFGNVTVNDGGSGKITGVTAGNVSSTSTDAVNGSQLYQANQNLTNLGNSTASSLGGTSSYNPVTGTVTAGLVVGGSTYGNVNDALQAVNANASQARSTVSQGSNIVVTTSTNPDGSTNYQVATSANLNVNGVTAGNTTVNASGVTVAGGANGPVSVGNGGLNNGGNTISNVAAGVNGTDAVNVNQLRGISAGGVQYDKNANGSVNPNSLTLNAGGTGPTTIRNLAAGVAPTDAVNVGQLNSGLGNTLSQANAYTDGRLADINNDIWTTRRDYRGATSSAMAMAGLPQAYLPGKSMLAAGVGGYQGQYGIAVGLSGITENGKWVYKAQASGNTARDWGFTAGVGIQW